MMDAFDLASRLFGNSRAESRGDVSNSLDILTATGAGDSSDGAATVYLDADVTPADDYDGDDYAIGIPTSPNVIEGDGVLVGLTGSGALKTPVVISNPGSGDRMQVQISNAETLAEQAEAVATATGQHFWPDDDGVHVTEVTQEGWNDAESPDYHSGANVLLNALGQLFRDGLNNILAILSGTTPGLAIYDGTGNTADHILAEFASDHVRIGGAIPEDGSAVATVRFFDSDADKGAMVEGYVSNSYSPTDEDVGWGVQTQDTYTDLHTSTNDSDMEQVNGCAGTADVRLGQTTYWEDGPDGYYQAESTATLTSTADSGTDPTQTAHASASLGVKAVTVNDSAEEAYLTVNGNDVPMEQAIIALQQPYAVFSGNNGTSNATGTGWRLTYFNTTQSNSGNWSDYFTNSNGVITAKRNIRLEISGCMNWTDSVSGSRGFGVFVNSSTAGSGTEYSEFQSFPNTVNTRKSVWLTGLVLSLNAGMKFAFGRYEQSGAVYQTGTNFSRVELKVLGTY